ncbi:MAG: AAA family ATPase [Muribaculaceae bacterium]|nr:AAA family ATPase [Muribaculaceae bacterium]
MRIESIKIHNLRQLKDITLRFVKQSGENDLNIILAENGVGKTNILNAITWCLYNQEMHLRDKKNALPIVNTQVVEEMIQYGGGQVDVSVELIVNTDDNDKITFRRIAMFNVTNDDVVDLNDKLSISYLGKDGYRIVDSDEETKELVHKYLPEEICNYIFFDGEQLEKFFSFDQLKNVKDGIHEFTQASYLKYGYEYLEKYVKEFINSKISKGGDKELKELQKKVEELDSQISLSEITIEEIKNNIFQCESHIDELTAKIHGCENVREKAEELKESELRLSRLNDDLDSRNEDLIIFTREYFTLFALYSSVSKFFLYIEKQKNEGKLPPNIDTGLLDKILADKECLVCGRKHLTDEDLEAVRNLRNSITVASETSNVLSNALGAMTSYFSKVQSFETSKAKLIKGIGSIKKDIEQEEKKYQKLNSYLRSIPNNEDIANALDERDEYKKKLRTLYGNKAKEEEKKAHNEKAKDEEEKKLSILTAKNSELKELLRKKEFCQRCIKLMKESMHEILDECRESIQEETFRIFDRLIWKKDSFSKVEILEDYTFRLLDRFGNQALGSCSAAETALLALSFTLALQEVSKHDSLLFIDTPIGRVGKENRINFMNILLEIAKEKQVILTFTPTEYDNNVQTILGSRYNSFNTLRMSEGIAELAK